MRGRAAEGEERDRLWARWGEIDRDLDTTSMHICGIGGIQSWQDAVEFMLLGASSVQVCTAVMHYGFRVVEHLISGLEMWMLDHGFASTTDFIGTSVPLVGDWGELDLADRILDRVKILLAKK